MTTNTILNKALLLILACFFTAGHLFAQAGTYYIQNVKSKKYLSVPNDQKTDGSEIIQTSLQYNENQKWEIVEAGDGLYFIRSIFSRKCIEGFRSYYYDFNELLQWKLTGDENQKWRIERQSDSSYYFISKSRDHYWDVPRGSEKNGIKIIQYRGNGGPNERWILHPVANVKTPLLKFNWLHFTPISQQTKTVQLYHRNGKLAEKYFLKNHRLNGPFIKYFENGDTAAIGNFVNDELNGAFKTYLPGNKVKIIKEYYRDIETNIWQYNDDSLLYHAIRVFKNRMPTKNWTLYNIHNTFLKEEQIDLSEVLQIDKNIFISEHFVYFSSGNNRILELERKYKLLADYILTPFERNLTPIHGKKIKYHGEGLPGVMAGSWIPGIVDQYDKACSHEIVHDLLWKYPHNGPFAEGMAQCFGIGDRYLQLNHNMRDELFRKRSYYGSEFSPDTVTDGLSAVKTIKNWENKSPYNVMASFIYFHFFILNKTDQNNFVKFLKYLTDDFNAKKNSDIFKTYNSCMGRSMEETDKAWIKWLWSVQPETILDDVLKCGENVDFSALFGHD